VTEGAVESGLHMKAHPPPGPTPCQFQRVNDKEIRELRQAARAQEATLCASAFF